MTGFVIVVLVAVVVVLAVLLLRRNRASSSPTAPVDPLRRDARGIDPRAVKVGDVINHEGRDWLVRGTLAFDQDGFQWQEHLLDDATTRRWLSVEDDEELELVMWQSVSGADLQPGARSVTHEGIEYVLDEHGTATFRAAGSTGTAAQGNVEYYDYAAGERRLSFERYGSGSWEIGSGEVVNERSLDIYPSNPGS